MNYLQLINNRSPNKNHSNTCLEIPANNAQAPSIIEEEHWKDTNNQDWEKWIAFQAQLYKRHENRLWFLRDKIQDVQATGSQTAMAMDQVLDFIFEDLNPWRKDIANLVVPMAQCFKGANFNPYQMMEAMDRLHRDQEKIIEQNNYLKGYLDTINVCLKSLKEELKKLKDTAQNKSVEFANIKSSIESQFQALEIAIEMAKQKSEEGQDGAINKEELNKFKEGIENRLEAMDIAIDIAKERTENDSESKLNKEEFENYRNALEERLEVFGNALDMAKQRNEEDNEIGTTEQENLKGRTEKLEIRTKELEAKINQHNEPKTQKIYYTKTRGQARS